MGKRVPHLGEDPATGRLFYRRVYPEALRPFLSPRRRELKVPLGANGVLSSPAMRQWERANAQFESDVRAAKALRALQFKAAAGSFDELPPERVQFLVETFAHNWSAADEEKLRSRGGDWAARALGAWEDHLDNLQRWRVESDLEAMESWWGKQADQLLAEEGIRLAPSDHDARERLLWAMNAMALQMSEVAQARLKGRVVPLPPAPERALLRVTPLSAPAPSETFEAIVLKLVDSGRKPMSPTTKESVRTALRLFREANGRPTPSEITVGIVAEWLDLLAQRPAQLPKEHRDTPLPKLVALYRNADVARLSAKTLIQHVSALGARWTQATKSDLIPRGTANPFKGQDLAKPRRPQKAKGFSSEELAAMLALPVFTANQRPLGGKGEASYWIPLILLHTGARPEEIAQLLVADISQDQKSKRWMFQITDEGAHPHKGAKSLKNDESPRTFPVPGPLMDLGLLRYVETLKKANETALFPKLRPKGARGYLHAQFGAWWSGYLKANGIELEGQGRQPLREFRHTWSTAARASGVPREAMAYIQGHALIDATSGEGYGDRQPLGMFIDRVQVEGFELSSIKAWTSTSN